MPTPQTMRNPRMRTQDTAPSARKGGQSGFSLVEVLVAAGITGAILISISGLFILGTQKVKSGRNLSTATTVGQSVLEEMRGFRGRKIYGLLEGQEDDAFITWNTDQANPVYTEGNLDFADEYNAVLDGWRDMVRDDLPRGRLDVTVEGFTNRPQGANPGTAPFGSSRFLRVEVTISWTEIRRNRRVTMNLIKF